MQANALAVRVYFLVLAALGLAALLLGIENRLTPGLFAIAPPVDLVPPLDPQAWFAAFVRHQQDPVFAACGGAENLSQFQVLYWWEWLRRGSAVLLAGTFGAGFVVAGLLPEYRLRAQAPRPALPPRARLSGRRLGPRPRGRSGRRLARYNTGQYRHALDMTFAGAALALVIAAAIAPPDRAARPSSWSRAGALWIALIILDLGSGALFASRDAISVWRGFPGYEAGMLPPLDRLTAYAPWWLNFTFNQYMIQLVHRVLSVALWAALLVNVFRSGRSRSGAVALISLMTAQMAAGVVTLLLGGSAPASFLHEVGAVLLLAGAFVVLRPGRAMPRADQA